MLWEKLALVKNDVIVQIFNFFWRGLHTGRGRYGKEMLNFYLRVLYNADVVVKIVAKYIVKKLAMVKVCICANSEFRG